MQSIAKVLEDKINELVPDKDKSNKKNYISQEFQDYAIRVAHEFNDAKRKSLYIRYAKYLPRAILENAYAFVKDYPNAKNKGKLFMWKMHELLEEYKIKHPEFKIPSFRKKNNSSKNLSPKSITKQKAVDQIEIDF